MGSVPARYPPPWRVEEALGAPTDAEPIEVGVLVVGAGPAGLACAIRLGQLLEEHPETAERLGDVPVAVLEKGKQPGSHLLSGAVVNPRGLHRLFAGRKRIADLPLYGEVGHESVYFLTPEAGAADPAAADDAQPRQLGRLALAARAVPRRRGGGGRRDDPARDARGQAARRRRPRPRRAHRRPGPRPRRGGARQLRARLGPARPRDRPRRGNPGPPDRRGDRPLRAAGRQPAGLGARGEGGLEGRAPARPRDPHDGLAASLRSEVPRVRRLVRLPDRRRHGHDRDGRRARLPRRRAVRPRPAAGAEDAPADPADPRGRRAGRVGREDDPGAAASTRCRSGCTRRGCSSAATAPASSTSRP